MTDDYVPGTGPLGGDVDSAAGVESKFQQAANKSPDSIYQPTGPTEAEVEEDLAALGPITTESPD